MASRRQVGLGFGASKRGWVERLSAGACGPLGEEVAERLDGGKLSIDCCSRGVVECQGEKIDGMEETVFVGDAGLFEVAVSELDSV